MSTHSQHHNRPSNHGHEHPDAAHAPDDGQAEILDLDAEVMAEHLAALTAWLPVQAAPREILDLGAGTGTGSWALLSQFPEAHVTAVDSSAAHLDRLRTTARAANLSDRVRTVQADLDALDWPALGVADLVWAAASMHHLAEPDRVLRRVRDLLAPDGLIAIVELAGFPRFLPPTAPEDRPGLEDRIHAATQQLHAELMPHRGADWGPKLTTAGFTLGDSLVIDVDIKSSPSNAVARYALAVLQRIRGSVTPALSVEDLNALDQLLDTSSPRSILRRSDLAVRTTRSVWVARPSHEDAAVAMAPLKPTATDGSNERFSAAAEAANCERVLGDRRHGLDPSGSKS